MDKQNRNINGDRNPKKKHQWNSGSEKIVTEIKSSLEGFILIWAGRGKNQWIWR
jgi:hypothetical protein